MRSTTENALSRIANGVLFATFAISSGWFLYAVLAGKPHLYQKLIPASVAFACIVLFKCRPNVRILTALVMVSSWGALYLSELVLSTFDPERARSYAVREHAIKAGLPFDERSRLQIVGDLRKAGKHAYPAFYPTLLLNHPFQVSGEKALPLSSLPRVVSVACNEGGEYFTYETDELGFANPPGIWPTGHAEVAIVGDSTAVGECVPSQYGLATQIRSRFPNTVTLGSGGNGPLLELATLKEFLPILKPNYVFWFFYEGNDMADLEREKRDEILRRYLCQDFTQGLMHKRPDLEVAIEEYLEKAIADQKLRIGWFESTIAFLSLRNLRVLVSQAVDAVFALDEPEGDFALLERIFGEANQTVRSWGGQMVIIYLPAPFRYSYHRQFSKARRSFLDKVHVGVSTAASNLRIPLIDATSSFPDQHPYPANPPYFYPYTAHYTPKGYSAVGTRILNGLTSVLPSPSAQ